MKTSAQSSLAVRTVLLAALCLATSIARSQSVPGVPEPGLILYGTITNSTSGQPLFNGAVNWQISGGGDSASVTATFVSVNGKSFYVARVPFETRSIPGVTFAKTPGTLGLTAGATTYTRAATVAGTNATVVPASLSGFSFGASNGDRGRIDRVDLLVTLDPNPDSDGDGVPDWAEAIAGTDPHDRNSVFKIDANIQPLSQGGLAIKWASVSGKTYAIYRTSDVGVGFTLLQSGITATAPLNSYTDAIATGTGPYFYRLTVQ